MRSAVLPNAQLPPLSQPQQQSNNAPVDGSPIILSQTSPSHTGNFPQGQAAPHTPAGHSTLNSYSDLPKPQAASSASLSGPLQISPPQFPHASQNQASFQSIANQDGHSAVELPPVRPVFGLSLEDLFNRDGSAVPMVVYQCLQAVDLFGLEVEGIYRLSGTASHVTRLRSIFDNGRYDLGPRRGLRSDQQQTLPRWTSVTQKTSFTTSIVLQACSSNFSETCLILC